MRLFLLGSFVICSLSLFSQEDNTRTNYSIEKDLFRSISNSQESVSEFDNRKTGVEGNPYFIDTWLEGSLLLKDGKNYSKGLLFKLDVSTNELYVQSVESAEVKVLYNIDIISFLLNNNGKTHVFEKYKLPGENGNLYCEVLYRDSIFEFIKSVRKEFKKADYVEKGVYATGNVNDHYLEKVTYYFKSGNQPLAAIALKEKALKAALTPYEKAFKAYYEDHEGGKQTERQVVALLKYLNSH